MRKLIKIGDTIILETKYSESGERYKSKVIDQTEHYIYIDYPKNMETDKTAFLLDGTQLKASFVANAGAVYLFDSEVAGKVKRNIPMIMLTYPGDEQLMKIQRRQYVRVETTVDAAVHSPNEYFPPLVCVTEDISAGGASLSTKSLIHLEPEMDVNLWLVLLMHGGEYHYLNLKSKVVRIINNDDSKRKISVQFSNINPNERQLLLRFCFDRQLALKKRGIEA
ncbi:flagellar brake protein [Cytobacillus gottheilii]|uniref:flagellar brake protein n=1 Tax=Cytobacillus gottheilii TaxID=859144 RepID=UPI0027D45844|nr:flagellar brake domain-containing protein [Cytobacillus gottheilii]